MFTSVIKKKGRPCKLSLDSYYLKTKKENLFGNTSNNQYMNLVNIAYHSNKINKTEKDIAIYLENLYFHAQKGLGIKTIPKSSPSTWTTKIKPSYSSITKNQEKALNGWNNIKNYLQKNEPKIANEFLNLICSHHSYEELLALKFNFQVMDILKQGLSCIEKMFRRT